MGAGKADPDVSMMMRSGLYFSRTKPYLAWIQFCGLIVPVAQKNNHCTFNFQKRQLHLTDKNAEEIVQRYQEGLRTSARRCDGINPYQHIQPFIISWISTLFSRANSLSVFASPNSFFSTHTVEIQDNLLDWRRHFTSTARTVTCLYSLLAIVSAAIV